MNRRRNNVPVGSSVRMSMYLVMMRSRDRTRPPPHVVRHKVCAVYHPVQAGRGECNHSRLSYCRSFLGKYSGRLQNAVLLAAKNGLGFGEKRNRANTIILRALTVRNRRQRGKGDYYAGWHLSGQSLHSTNTAPKSTAREYLNIKCSWWVI